ncbi:MAG TPA: phage major capsid protein [Terricaulis sp.]|nr:phage major capsid protein [Terricaulis sp.]
MSKTALEVKEAKFEDLPAESKALVAPVLKKLDALQGELDKKANSADVVDKGSLEKALADVEASKKAVNDAIAEINKKAAELQRSGGGEGGRNAEIKSAVADLRAAEADAFDDYMRTGEVEAMNGVKKLAAEIEKKFELKDLSTIVFADGGAMVHPEREADMIDIIQETSPMREIARVIEIGTKEIEIPVNTRGTNAAWVTELATRLKTDTSEISRIKIGASEIYALPLVTQSILEDAEFDVEAWLQEEAVQAIVMAENLAFVKGDGNQKPKGFCSYDKVANANWVWGKHGYVVTGLSAGFKASVPGASPSTASVNGADCLYDLIYAFPQALRGNLDWTMNRQTLGTVRKLKDGDGRYVVRDPITQNGFLTMLLGYPVQEFEDMDNIGADSFSIALGDFEQGYMIVDRIGLTVKRDDLTAPGFVRFHFRRRTGGGARDFQAIKFLKFGTS